MTKNLLPGFVKEGLINNYPDVSAIAILLEIDKLPPLLPAPTSPGHSGGWLSPEEEEIFQAFTMQKRKNEWLAGRVCTKVAVRDFLSITNINLPCNQIIIDNAASGRPRVVLPGHKNFEGKFDLSISHSARYAIALIAGATCGIDIQEARQTLVRIKEKFCLPEEEVLLTKTLRKKDNIAHLTLLWSVKEAVRKAFSNDFVPEFLKLKVVKIETAGKQLWRMHLIHPTITATVLCGLFKQYGIAICIRQGHLNAGTPRS